MRVTVQSRYLKNQSQPMERRFAFAYTVRILNEGKGTVQLRSRHWVITDADNAVREVKGEGVVGEQPILKPGESFEYTSGCILNTAWGTMQGSYRFTTEDGEAFEAEIAPFLLASSLIETAQQLN